MMRKLIGVFLLCVGLFCLSQEPQAQRSLLLRDPLPKAAGGGTLTSTCNTTGFITVGSVASPVNWTNGFTISSGSGLALEVFLTLSRANNTSETVTWDPAGANQSLTQLGTTASNTGVAVEQWALLNPTPGATKTIQYAGSFFGNTEVAMSGCSFTGANQGSLAAAFPNSTSNSGNGTSFSVGVTSAGTNHIV